MNWTQYWLAAQLLSEERVGTLIRQEAAREEAAFNAVVSESDE